MTLRSLATAARCRHQREDGAGHEKVEASPTATRKPPSGSARGRCARRDLGIRRYCSQLGFNSSAEFAQYQYSAVSVNADWIVPVFFESSLPTIIRTALGWSFANNYGTNLDMFQTTTSAWDVAVRELDYGSNGAVGWIDCPPTAVQSGSHPSHHCADQVFRIDDVYIYDYDTTNEARNLVCHELGHTVGLRHSNDSDSPGSCMFLTWAIPRVLD